MKNYILFIFATLIISNISAKNDSIIKSMINNSQFFELYEEYPSLKEGTTEFIQLRAEAVIYTHFNSSDKAITAINEIFTKFSNEIDVQTWVELMVCMGLNYAEIGKYDFAVNIFDQLVNYLSSLSSDENALKSLTEIKKLYLALSKIPTLKISEVM